jgi:hypothetical protein
MTTSVTASGCETMITWEPSTSVMVAPARSAIERTTSVPAALSRVNERTVQNAVPRARFDRAEGLATRAVGEGSVNEDNRCLGPLCSLHRNDLNAARSSWENSSGSSHAAKWPPLSTSLK